MKKRVFMSLSLILIGAMAFGQSKKTDIDAQKALSNLSFIIGKWAGSGWMLSETGKKEEFTQTEDISYKLGGTLILILGHGVSGEEIIHDALAIVSYDTKKNKLSFRSYLANGTQGEFPAELKDNALCWYPTETMRYVIKLNNKNQWQEVGEINRAGNWSRFFEMTLDKVK